ncbi:MAG: BamA/TamA family outer membrane protein, partial [Rhizobacter sp.]|nr:BamA/TamA family outer membrane protein [Chlorobiales bacterium]
SLRFKGADGKEYKLRSLDKSANLTLLPKDLQESVAADVLQDQVCTSNPLSVLVAAPLVRAAGILSAQPQVVVIADSAGLGAFTEFWNMPATLEQNPTAEKDDDNSFGGADKISSSYKFFDKLDEDNDNRVQTTDFLKARLIDLFIGDWDRHIDQWRWARYDDGNLRNWRVIPRDRDHAFDRFDGLLPWIAEQASPQLKGFTDTYPNVRYVSTSARFLDRRLLSTIEKPVWDSVSTWLISRLTDSVLTDAVHQLPPEMYAQEGKEMERILKARRDKFREMSDEFYALNLSEPDVWASDKNEVAEVIRLPDGRVAVSIYKRDKKSGEKKNDAFLQRVFVPSETQEIRLYLQGGDDLAIVSGEATNTIRVRIIGGGGTDEFIDRSIIGSGLFGGAQTLFYDTDNGSRFTSGASTVIIRDSVKAVMNTPQYDVPNLPREYASKYNPPVDYGSEWFNTISNTWFNVLPDYGLFLGWGVLHNIYGFRTYPFASQFSLRAGYAPAAGRFAAEFKSDFRALIPAGRVLVEATSSGLSLLNFYGFGNESVRLDESKTPEDYYRSTQQLYTVNLALEYPLTGSLPSQHLLVFGGLSAKYIGIDRDDFEKYLPQAQPYGIDNRFIAGVSGGLRLNMRDGVLNPRSGIWIEATAAYYPPLDNVQESFVRAKADARGYVPLPRELSTVAVRIAAEKLWGKFPFYESAFIGGYSGAASSVRGFTLQRFAGDASILSAAEARVLLTKVRVVVPVSVGITLFGETGRVFADGETSSRWHGAGGGGIWLSVVDSEFLLNLSLAQSEEFLGVYLSGGFSF